MTEINESPRPTQRDFHAAAERIIADLSIDVDDVEALTEALNRECPGWNMLPPEILQSELMAIHRGWLNAADRELDRMNEMAQAAREEADLGPDLGGSPMEMES